VKLGASFTGVMVIVTVAVDAAAPSNASYVKLSVPL